MPNDVSLEDKRVEEGFCLVGGKREEEEEPREESGKGDDNFTIILRAAFWYKSVLNSFYELTV